MQFAMRIIVLSIFVFLILSIFGMAVSSIFRLVGGYGRAYEKLGKRYAGRIYYAHWFARPTLLFGYGRTQCQLRNRRASNAHGRNLTELIMLWPDRHLRMEILTPGLASRFWRASLLKPVEVQSGTLGAIQVTANDPDLAAKLLTPGAQWQIELLRRHADVPSIYVALDRGRLIVSKPGLICGYQKLDDFVRFGLELFDQMILSQSEAISFLNENQAAVVDDVKCPICSERVGQDMVMCVRCKTPHCFDCWEYNGQCATFACNETRFLRVGGQQSISRGVS
jgi:hypothetical protein